MYDELLKSLREQVKCDNKKLYPQGVPIETLLLDLAADAIEELSVVVRAQRAVLDKFPRWIPVTEQKPPLPEDEDVCYVQVIAAVKGKKEAEPVLYSRAYRFRDGKRVRIERFVGDGEVLEVTHWMPKPEPPEPPKEGKQ